CCLLALRCQSLCFFFSSRRRHTRFSRDWSSDVCSSDLLDWIELGAQPAIRAAWLTGVLAAAVAAYFSALFLFGFRPKDFTRRRRSEERRVGKECRSRGWRQEQKKK